MAVTKPKKNMPIESRLLLGAPSIIAGAPSFLKNTKTALALSLYL